MPTTNTPDAPKCDDPRQRRREAAADTEAAELLRRGLASLRDGADALRELMAEHGARCRCDLCYHILREQCAEVGDELEDHCAAEWWERILGLRIIVDHVLFEIRSSLTSEFGGN